jgi:hypothetical protein
LRGDHLTLGHVQLLTSGSVKFRGLDARLKGISGKTVEGILA